MLTGNPYVCEFKHLTVTLVQNWKKLIIIDKDKKIHSAVTTDFTTKNIYIYIVFLSIIYLSLSLRLKNNIFKLCFRDRLFFPNFQNKLRVYITIVTKVASTLKIH